MEATLLKALDRLASVLAARCPCCRSGLRPTGLKSPQDGWHASLDSFHLEAPASQNFEASQRVPSPRRPQKSVWESL